MADTSVTAVYVDHEVNYLAPDSRVGSVRVLAKPHAATCHHPVVDFAKPERRLGGTYVDCVCLSCGHRWSQVKVRSAHIADQLASLGGQDDG